MVIIIIIIKWEIWYYEYYDDLIEFLAQNVSS